MQHTLSSMSLSANESPIAFMGPLVLEILAGRKTVTRRIWSPPDRLQERLDSGALPVYLGRIDPGLRAIWALVRPGEDPLRAPRSARFRCRYGAPGDRLWVREGHWIVPASAYAMSREEDGSPVPHRVSPCTHYWAVYRADWTRSRPTGRIRPPMHLPRWGSRIDLEVKRVTLERVQEITEEDAIAEGALALAPKELPMAELGGAPSSPRAVFAALWARMHAKKGGWDGDPWVWRVAF